MTEDRAYTILTALRNIKLSISDEMNEQLKPWFDDIEKAIEELSQEPTEGDTSIEQALLLEVIDKCLPMPCDDAVSRDAVLDIICRETEWYDIRTQIEQLPSVTQKSGKWILLDECANSGYYCSNCQKKLVKEGWSQTVKKIKFCPNCGARMVEPQESEDKEW